MFFQKFNPFHHLEKTGLTILIDTVTVMAVFRAINGDSYKKVVISEKMAPIIGKRCSIGLQWVFNLRALTVFILEIDDLSKEFPAPQDRLAAMPGEQYLRQGAGIDLLSSQKGNPELKQ